MLVLWKNIIIKHYIFRIIKDYNLEFIIKKIFLFFFVFFCFFCLLYLKNLYLIMCNSNCVENLIFIKNTLTHTESSELMYFHAAEGVYVV